MMDGRIRSRVVVSLGTAFLLIIGAGFVVRGGDAPSPSPDRDSAAHDEPHRSPIALALSADGSRLLTANQTAGTVSLVDTAAGRVLHEVKTGEKPAGVALSRDGRRGAVAHWYGYDLAVLDIKDDRIAVAGRVEVGPEPRGVAVSADGTTAFVAVGVSNEVVRVDLNARKVTGRLAVGREPRGVALSSDGSRLVVGNARSGDVSVIDTKKWSIERTVPIDGDNLRQVAVAADGKTGYVANMKNRKFATTRNNIDLGWVLGQRLTKVALDGSSPTFSTLSLDPRGQAAADAHGIAVNKDGKLRGRGPGRHSRADDLPHRPQAAPLARRELARPVAARSCSRATAGSAGSRWAAGPPSWPSPRTARRSTWPTTSPTPSRSWTPRRPGSSARSRWAAPGRRHWCAAARSSSTTPRGRSTSGIAATPATATATPTAWTSTRSTTAGRT